MTLSETPARPETSQRRRLPWALLALVVLTSALAVSWSLATTDDSPAEDVARPLTVATAQVQPSSSYEVRRELVGRVEARRHSALGFELPGKLVAATVDEGDTVSQGQLLARLDTARLRARRAELEAQQARAEADLELARRTLGRIDEARQLDAVSSQSLDEAELTVAARQAALQGVQAALASIQVDLDKSALHAPFGAVIASRHVDEGTVVAAGQPVLDILEGASPQARVAVAGDQIDVFTVGQRHRLHIGSRSVEGTVVALLPVRQRSTRTVDVLLDLDTTLAEARPGDLAKLQLETSVESSGFWLPMTALTESNRGLWAAYVAEPESTDTGNGTAILARRQLELLYQEADQVYVRGTLDDGDRVVVSGLHRLTPGQRVVPTDATPESPTEGDSALSNEVHPHG